MSIPRLLALTGMVAVAAAVLLIGALHVIPPSSAISPYRRTISEYAHSDHGTVFNVAVLVLAAGSVAIMVALIGAGLAPARSGGVFALLLWCVALAAIVYFPKHNWAVGPSYSGTVHRWASVLAFLSLPFAALLTARAWRRHDRWRGHARWTSLLGVMSFLAFSPIVGAFLIQPWTGVRWWRLIPLGAVERVLLFSEICIVLVMAVWAARAAARAPGVTPEARPPSAAAPIAP
ncbi:DUF998 domain-containing protein [Paractinoplanes rishiriensis]|uniref:DUF998 domain-containing protein n=1 Tax=Paractinoplanes rishiriensis TaxID=1050105 RepID=A0A919KBX2_9ACTN|nr:DUF998 domain-containing protein [Actinoplanes rishiriensis]GIF00617.1 hypothetical protein Ari01nite_80810 [Actinoplanes rishiriensis]